MTAPRCPCCPDGNMQVWMLLVDDGDRRRPALVCSWCGHIEECTDTSPRKMTTLAASQRQFQVGD